jgi:8-oxo-dGTP pyrophosphatase MutT (NUDIX family)
MKEIEIIGKNFRSAVNTRIACRGLVLQDGKLLLSHERNTGWYLIPGGGLEDGESIEECCIRELLEETGYIVEPAEHFLTLKEYYGDWCYISHYFRCEAVAQSQTKLTALEESRGLEPVWVDFAEACAIFAAHESYAATNEEKRGSYQREDQALRVFTELTD